MQNKALSSHDTATWWHTRMLASHMLHACDCSACTGFQVHFWPFCWLKTVCLGCAGGRTVAADAPDLPWLGTKGQIDTIKQWCGVTPDARLFDDTICVPSEFAGVPKQTDRPLLMPAVGTASAYQSTSATFASSEGLHSSQPVGACDQNAFTRPAQYFPLLFVSTTLSQATLDFSPLVQASVDLPIVARSNTRTEFSGPRHNSCCCRLRPACCPQTLQASRAAGI